MIEKKIFTFWHTEELPELCEISVNSWQKYCPGFEIIVLNSTNFRDYIKRPIPEHFHQLTIQKKSNWIRCVLVYENGGIWMDTSILLTQDINTWFNFDCEFFGIRAGKRIENWSFGAPKHSPLILEWVKEYEFAKSIGPEKYEQKAMQSVDWEKWTYLFHQLCFLMACKKLSIDIFDEYNPSYFIKDVSEIGYPIDDIKLNFGEKWHYGYMLNAMKLGLESENKLPLYKLPNFTREWAEIALEHQIEDGSPLHRAGYTNESKKNIKSFKLKYHTIKLYVKSLIWRVVHFLGIKSPKQ